MGRLDENHIRNGCRIAQAITRHYAKTFYFASFFLPLRARRASYCVYTLLRMSDEAVDNEQQNMAPQALEEIQNKIKSLYRRDTLRDCLLLACRKTMEDYAIPEKYFSEFLEGMRMDRVKSRYNNFEELSGYCYKVAGVAGLIMLKILNPGILSGEKQAVDLGIAMQLTNILRDIQEDLQRNRIYLPQDEMRKFAVTENSLRRGMVDEKFKAFMRFQIGRAREYFDASTAGIKTLNCPRIRLCVSAMKETYSGILRQIENNGYDVF
ncbi:MAG: phytoene/squalene synthase family protein, partial [Candidatus Aenigmarchaeota archaeon]|nr:phytoene/squalene synthase family protein [Candidatus Aenigmarchaeota archaeon]